MERKTTKTQTYNGRNQHGQNLVLDEANKTEKSLVRQRGKEGEGEGGREGGREKRERKGYRGNINIKNKGMIISDSTDDKMITRSHYE